PERALACVARAEPGASGPVRARVAALRGQVQLRGGLLDAAVGTLCEGAALAADGDPAAALEMLFGASEAAGYGGAMPAVLDIAGRARPLPATTPGARMLRESLMGIAEIVSGQVEQGSARLGAAPMHAAGLTSPRWLMWAAY